MINIKSFAKPKESNKSNSGGSGNITNITTASEVDKYFYMDDVGNLHTPYNLIGDKLVASLALGNTTGGSGSGVEVIDNLNSESTNAALSAHLGKVLKEMILTNGGGGGAVFENATVLAGITQTDITNWNDANSKKHTHSNKSALDNLTLSVIDNSHSHTNKSAVDNLTLSVIDNSHTHTNKTVIDGITSTKVTNWDNAATKSHSHTNKTALDNLTLGVIDNSHTHANKSALDTVTSTKITNWDNTSSYFYVDADNNLHTSYNFIGDKQVASLALGSTSSGGGGSLNIVDNLTSTETNSALSANLGRVLKGLIDNISATGSVFANSTTLAKITENDLSNWNTAYTNNHTHSNLSVLDGITSAKVSNWDSAFGWGDHSKAGYLKSVSWSDIKSAPTSLPANGGTSTNSNQLNKNQKEIKYDENSLVYTNLTGVQSTEKGVWNTPSSTSTWWHELRFTHGNSAGYYTNLAIPFNANSIYYQRWTNGTLSNSSNGRSGWIKVLDDANWSDTISLSTLGAASSTHTHTAADVGALASNHAASGVTTTKISNWDTAYTNNHTHSNKSTLDGITSTKVSNWDTAYTNNHTHSNKTTLDGITSTKVSNWDDVASYFYLDKDNNLHTSYNFVGDKQVASLGLGSSTGASNLSIVDNLTSTSTNSALSANQGRVLKGLIDNISAQGSVFDNATTLAKITEDDLTHWGNAYSWGNHAGLYLPLSGGTMTGAIQTKSSAGISFPNQTTNGTRATTKTSGCHIHGGEDNASYDGASILIGTWYGFGIYPTISGLTRTQGKNSFWHNARSGNTYTVGDFYKVASNGTTTTKVSYEGHTHDNYSLTSHSHAWNDITSKPFTSVGSGLDVVNNSLQLKTYFTAHASGANSNGYLHICQIKIAGTYPNEAFNFRFVRRNDKTYTDLYILFSNSANADPTLSSFKAVGYTKDAYIIKTATSTWDLYIKTNGTYELLCITNYTLPYYMRACTVDFKSDFISTAIEGWTLASFGYLTNDSVGAERIPIYLNAGVPTSITIGSGTSDVERPLLLTNDSSELYKISSITANYAKKTLTVNSDSGGSLEFRAKRSGGSDVALMVGSSNANHGVYSNTAGKWIVYSDGSGNVTLNGNAAGLTGYSFKAPSTGAVTHSGWSGTLATDNKIIPTMGFMAYWNGAYTSNNSSNLKYSANGEIIGSNNIGSQSVNYATSAGKSQYLETQYKDSTNFYGNSYKLYGKWDTNSHVKLKVTDGTYTVGVDDAVSVIDYGDTSKTIKIGYSGTGLSSCSYLAAYGEVNGQRVIKDINTANVSVGSASIAGQLSDLNANDNASSSDTWRKLWISYNNGTTGRPAITDNLAFQTSTNTLKIGSAQLKYDSDKDVFRCNKPIVCDSYITAYDANGTGVPTTQTIKGASTVNIDTTASTGGTINIGHNTQGLSTNIFGYGVNIGSSTSRTYATNIYGSYGINIDSSNTLTLKGTNTTVEGGGAGLKLNGTGSAGITITSAGAINANKAITVSSDERLKNIGEDVNITFDDVSNSPVFNYSLKDDESNYLMIGSSAQYWLNKLPNAVKENENGNLSLDYTAVLLASNKALANKVKEQEETIKSLEERLSKIEQLLLNKDNG